MMNTNLKRSWLRLTLLAAFPLALLMAMTGTALACDCHVVQEKISFQRSDLVFEGEVVRIDEVDHRTVYTFPVTKVLKGSAEREVTITGTGSNCDDSFENNVSYRVYARRYEGKLISSQCSGNKKLKTHG